MAKLITLKCSKCHQKIRFIYGPLKKKPAPSEAEKNSQVEKFFEKLEEHAKTCGGGEMQISLGFAD